MVNISLNPEKHKELRLLDKKCGRELLKSPLELVSPKIK